DDDQPRVVGRDGVPVDERVDRRIDLPQRTEVLADLALQRRGDAREQARIDRYLVRHEGDVNHGDSRSCRPARRQRRSSQLTTPGPHRPAQIVENRITASQGRDRCGARRAYIYGADRDPRTNFCTDWSFSSRPVVCAENPVYAWAWTS